MITYNLIDNPKAILAVAAINDQILIQTRVEDHVTSQLQIPIILAHVLIAALSSEVESATILPSTPTQLDTSLLSPMPH
jgi:hypothetical protein